MYAVCFTLALTSTVTRLDINDTVEANLAQMFRTLSCPCGASKLVGSAKSVKAKTMTNVGYTLPTTMTNNGYTLAILSQPYIY